MSPIERVKEIVAAVLTIQKATGDEFEVCATIEQRPGGEHWAQIVIGSLNLCWPFSDEPGTRLAQLRLEQPPGLRLEEWEARRFATFRFETVSVLKLAEFIDGIFVKLYGCDADALDLGVKVERL